MIVIKKRIGIPRSLLYYKYFPLWKTFLEELGVEIVLSDRTNSKIIDIGGRYAIDEICIPLKLYYGHVLNLLEKNIDYLFVPRYVSTTIGTYFCPKFLGLPDMVRGTIDNLPPIIEFEVNMQKRPMYLSAYKLGKVLHKSTWQIKKAYEKAIKDYKYFRQLMVDGLSFKKALILNYIVASAIFLGTVAGEFIKIDPLILISFMLGNYLYISLVDLYPQILNKRIKEILPFFLGLAIHLII